MRFWPVTPFERVYDVLARQPDGAVIELPLYSRRFAFLRTKYMLASTLHWKPLVGGYSGYIPDDFARRAPVLGDFPTAEALAELGDGVQYAVFHLGEYTEENRRQLLQRLARFSNRLSAIAADGDAWLFRIEPSPAVTSDRAN
jgi:hypothetical protein